MLFNLVVKVILVLNYPFYLCGNYDVIESCDIIHKRPGTANN